jgi:hypothetical protein
MNVALDKNMQYHGITNSKGVIMAERIGSFNEYREINNLRDDVEARLAYGLALDGLRRQIAEERSLTLEELHLAPFPVDK